MKSFIDNIKGTYISAQELYEAFKALQLMTPEELIAFWQTLQFTVETDAMRLNSEDQKKIGYIEKTIVENMINLVGKHPNLKQTFYKIVLERDNKRDPTGIFKLFGTNSDYERFLSDKLK